MNHIAMSTLTLRSEVQADGTLALSLTSVPLPRPGLDDIVVELEAAPLHPADIGLLLGPADLSSGRRTGMGPDSKIVFDIPKDRLVSVTARTGMSLPVGNEGAGVVVAAGDNQRGLLGKTVAVMGGGMLSRHRVVDVSNALILPDGIVPREGAAALINPLTLLAMIETMRAEGHHALIHTAAASSLGRMLNRVCLEDGIPLVNIVRRPEQASLLITDGASFVCDTSSDKLVHDLDAAVAATGATLAFDALSGGSLAGQILSAMERACNMGATEYSRYGSAVHKQVYFYGGLDTRPTVLDRSYGMAWGVGGWLLFDRLKRLGSGKLETMKARIAAELKSNFATGFTTELSLSDVMEKTNFTAFAKRATGSKYLVNPRLDLA